jgi:hypothetical protein
MKKVFSLTVASLFTLLSVAYANPPAGNLRITNFSRHNVMVVVDGRVVHDRDDHVMIGGLRPGYHEVKVYRKQAKRGLFGSTRGKLMYNSRVYVSPGTSTRVIIDRNGRVSVDRQRGRGNRDRHYDDGPGRGRRDRNWHK